MPDEVMNTLSTVSLGTVVAIVVLVSAALKVISPWFDKLKTAIIKKYKKDTKEADLSKMIQEDHARIETYEDNRVHDREQSFKIQKELVDAISAINVRLDELQRLTDQRFAENRSREDKRTRAELKDRISQLYRVYSSAGHWTHMEKEALEDLIQEYEDAGGDNSFVHSVVQKNMYTWDLVD